MSERKAITTELLNISNKYCFNNPEDAYNYQIDIIEIFGEFQGLISNLNQPNLTFTRARKNKESQILFNSKSEVWYPNSAKVNVKIGRANLPTFSKFYASNDAGTAIFEMRPKIGELITLIDVDIKKENLELLFLGVDCSKVPSSNLLSEKDKGIHDFLRLIFREIITENEYWNYTKTAMIAHLFINNADGIVYPSIGSNCKGWNVVFNPDFIDEYGVINKGRVVEIIDKKSDYDITILCKYESNKLDARNDFNWVNTRECGTHKITESIYHK